MGFSVLENEDYNNINNFIDNNANYWNPINSPKKNIPTKHYLQFLSLKKKKKKTT